MDSEDDRRMEEEQHHDEDDHHEECDEETGEGCGKDPEMLAFIWGGIAIFNLIAPILYNFVIRTDDKGFSFSMPAALPWTMQFVTHMSFFGPAAAAFGAWFAESDITDTIYVYAGLISVGALLCEMYTAYLFMAGASDGTLLLSSGMASFALGLYGLVVGIQSTYQIFTMFDFRKLMPEECDEETGEGCEEEHEDHDDEDKDDDDEGNDEEEEEEEEEFGDDDDFFYSKFKAVAF
jgi:hypothetical protein